MMETPETAPISSDPPPQVTTIVRAFNRRDKTLRALASAIVQTLGNQPIVVVDDGSTDGLAAAVAEVYGDRIKLVRHTENRGVGAAANSGIDAVETPFAAFLDNDDTWHPSFLETMLTAIQAAPGATLAYCNFRFVYEEYGVDYPTMAKEPDAIADRLSAPPYTMSTVLVRTASARAAGRFLEDQVIGEDFDFYMRLWLRSPDSFVHVERHLADHTIWRKNTTADLNRLIADMDALTDKYVQHPNFKHMKDRRTEILRLRLLGVAARRQVGKWLAAEPTRPLSLIVSGIETAASLRRSLESAAAQRLPPIDVALLTKADGEAVHEIATESWPFAVHVLATKAGMTLGRQYKFALNSLTGGAIVFLEAGEEFEPGALDAHRRAFSACPRPVLLSYGGLNGAIPERLPRDTRALALRASKVSAPGSLSAMAISRKALISLPGFPKSSDDGYWFGLLLHLLRVDGSIVRVRRSVVRGATVGPIAATALCHWCGEVSESDFGRSLTGTLDQIRDECGVGGSE